MRMILFWKKYFPAVVVNGKVRPDPVKVYYGRQFINDCTYICIYAEKRLSYDCISKRKD